MRNILGAHLPARIGNYYFLGRTFPAFRYNLFFAITKSTSKKKGFPLQSGAQTSLKLRLVFKSKFVHQLAIIYFGKKRKP